MNQMTTTNKSNGLEIMGMKVQSFQEVIKMAEYFASTDLVPADYRGKGANIVVAWQKGMELGLKPLQSLATIAVVNGRATIWGDGLIALVKNSSKEEWTNEWIEGEGDNMVAFCETKRSSQKQTIKRSFSVIDAKTAKLWGNNTWAKYPPRMLQMRARGLALRDAYPDVLNGLEIAEEMNDLHFQQKKEAIEAPKTLAQLGLTSVEKDGYLMVQGNSYGKTELLKQLGFQFINNAWCKELPIGEEVIDIEVHASINEMPPILNNKAPALELMEYLIKMGIEKARVGEFVKDVLGATSKDTETIVAVLADKSSLNEMISTFLNMPTEEANAESYDFY